MGGNIDSALQNHLNAKSTGHIEVYVDKRKIKVMQWTIFIALKIDNTPLFANSIASAFFGESLVWHAPAEIRLTQSRFMQTTSIILRFLASSAAREAKAVRTMAFSVTCSALPKDLQEVTS
jgi:hypothetical protein